MYDFVLCSFSLKDTNTTCQAEKNGMCYSVSFCAKMLHSLHSQMKLQGMTSITCQKEKKRKKKEYVEDPEITPEFWEQDLVVIVVLIVGGS